MFTVPKMERPAGTHIQKKLEVTGLEEKKKKLEKHHGLRLYRTYHCTQCRRWRQEAIYSAAGLEINTATADKEWKRDKSSCSKLDGQTGCH